MPTPPLFFVCVVAVVSCVYCLLTTTCSYTVLLLWTQAEAGPPAKVHELGAGAQTIPPAVSLAPTTARPAVVPFKKMERIKTGFLGMFVKSI